MRQIKTTLVAAFTVIMFSQVSAEACYTGAWSTARLSKASSAKLISLRGHFATVEHHKSERAYLLAFIDSELKRRGAR